jgi:hypothetical protein
LPEFDKNFDNGITDAELLAAFNEKVNAFVSKLNN